MFVDSLEVTEGQKVEKEQVLYKLNLTKIDEKIQTLEREITKLTLQNEQTISENAAESEKRQRSINRATEAYQETIAAGKQAIAKALKELTAAQTDLTKLDKNKENYEEEKTQLEAKITEKQTVYDEAVENDAKSVNEARRLVEQEEDPVSTSTTIDQAQKDIDEKQTELERLRYLRQINGEIKADFSGMVTGVAIKTGGLTTNETPLLLVDDSVGLRLQLQFSKDDQKYLTLGAEVSLTKAMDGTKIDNQKILSITEDKENPEQLNVVLDVPKENIEIGETLQGEINVPAKKYEHCIPIEALHIDEADAYYVYAISQKETIMGSEKVIEKIPVVLLDKNTQYAAVTGLNSDKQIVTETDKEIKERTVVRVNE